MMATLLAFAACTGDPPPDNSNFCTGVTYDPCNDEHNCDNAMCQNFMGDGFQVCTQTCDAATPCPTGGTCNAMGICKPDAGPKVCTIR
jgi:hypothetical protein